MWYSRESLLADISNPKALAGTWAFVAALAHERRKLCTQPYSQNMKSAVSLAFRRCFRTSALSALALSAGLFSAYADYKSAVLADKPAGYWRFNEAGVV